MKRMLFSFVAITALLLTGCSDDPVWAPEEGADTGGGGGTITDTGGGGGTVTDTGNGGPLVPEPDERDVRGPSIVIGGGGSGDTGNGDTSDVEDVGDDDTSDGEDVGDDDTGDSEDVGDDTDNTICPGFSAAVCRAACAPGVEHIEVFENGLVFGCQGEVDHADAASLCAPDHVMMSSFDWVSFTREGFSDLDYWLSDQLSGRPMLGTICVDPRLEVSTFSPMTPPHPDADYYSRMQRGNIWLANDSGHILEGFSQAYWGLESCEVHAWVYRGTLPEDADECVYVGGVPTGGETDFSWEVLHYESLGIIPEDPRSIGPRGLSIPLEEGVYYALALGWADCQALNKWYEVPSEEYTFGTLVDGLVTGNVQSNAMAATVVPDGWRCYFDKYPQTVITRAP